jgi:hypothetical protein
MTVILAYLTFSEAAIERNDPSLELLSRDAPVLVYIEPAEATADGGLVLEELV